MTEQEAFNDPEMKVILLLSGYIREVSNGASFEETTYKTAEQIVKLFAIPVITDSCCPKCCAPEVEAMKPRTKYKCGSGNYDQIPNTFKQTIRCKLHALFNWR